MGMQRTDVQYITESQNEYMLEPSGHHKAMQGQGSFACYPRQTNDFAKVPQEL